MAAITQPLAYVRDITGRTIRLNMFESVRDIKATDAEIVLAINAAKSSPSRCQAWRVTKRGIVLYRFILDQVTMSWILIDTVPVWWSTDELYTR